MEATTQDHRAWIGDSPVDPVTLEFYRHLFTELTEEMGAALRRAAFSPYIKERRDYSCALFSPDGTSVAMGDHMPVHLGTMPLSVSAALDDLGVLEPGDVACVNDPFRGETHLPDVTLIAPVYGSGTADLLGFVASRTHHSDMGGATPGSMPLAREIHEEGFRIPPRPNRARGRACRRPLAPRARERAHTGGAGRGPGRTARRPARGPEATRGTLVSRRGAEEVSVAMAALVRYADRMVQAGLAQDPTRPLPGRGFPGGRRVRERPPPHSGPAGGQCRELHHVPGRQPRDGRDGVRLHERREAEAARGISVVTPPEACAALPSPGGGGWGRAEERGAAAPACHDAKTPE